MRQIHDDAFRSIKWLEIVCSFFSCFKIPSPYTGGQGGVAGSAWEDRQTTSWRLWVPLPCIGDSRPTPFAPFDTRAKSANKEFCGISSVSFAPKPHRSKTFLNRNYEERRQREGGYSEKFVKTNGMWGCNCPRPPGHGCPGWRPCPCWVKRCFFCRRGIWSWESRLEHDASPEMCYGFTSVFMSDSGEHQEYSDSVNRWKQVCFQCGYLKVLRDYSSVARQVMDTAAQAERVQDIKEKQEDSVQDLRVVSE